MEGKSKVGRQGEELACQYLVYRRFSILEKNARLGHHEVDIIARDGKDLVFVEVKARTGSAYGTPEEAVTTRKLHNLEQALARYVAEHREVAHARIDVVSVYFSEGTKPRVKHFRAVGNGRLAFLS
ncbi:MAG: YraN family protein [Patescibacteria group bacterium]|jgi:putative endonuclease